MSKNIYVNTYNGNIETSIDRELIEEIIKTQLASQLKEPIQARVGCACAKINEEYIDSLIEKTLPELITKMVENKVAKAIGMNNGSSYNKPNLDEDSVIFKMINDLIKEIAEKRIDTIFNSKSEEIIETVKKELDARTSDIKNIKYFVAARVKELLNKKVLSVAEEMTKELLNENC
jgi:carbon monoxide dehydrogenase subunit G